jgi:hypothetical protein
MKVPFMKPMGPMAPRFIAGFDSASTMTRSLGRFLNGKDSAGLAGAAPPSDTLASAVNALPWKARDLLYTVSGAGEAIPVSKLGEVRSEAISDWVTSVYPQRIYPAVMIGSSSGALVHLAAALGIPWLPQTMFIPVRRTGVHPDEPVDEMEWGRQHAAPLLDANPDLQLHHMHDPNQDRLMIQLMTYFRVKRLRMGEGYEKFLRERLTPGGTIYLVECTRQWATTKVGDRHIFQFGALGGATPEEFLHGSERVEKYLEQYESHRRRWEPPQPDGDRPEAEWGFEPALRDDVERFAREHGFRVERIVFEEPEHLSPFVAELYRWWYHQREIPANRLFVESFIVLDPYWTLRAGAVPFWLKFNMDPSYEWLEHYLDTSDPYDYINLTLFSHGVECVGLSPIERWEELLKRARKEGSFVGVDKEKFPRDFGVYARYSNRLSEIPARYPIPGPLAISQMERFIREEGGRFPVQWKSFIEASASAAG